MSAVLRKPALTLNQRDWSRRVNVKAPHPRTQWDTGCYSFSSGSPENAIALEINDQVLREIPVIVAWAPARTPTPQTATQTG